MTFPTPGGRYFCVVEGRQIYVHPADLEVLQKRFGALSEGDPDPYWGATIVLSEHLPAQGSV